ncbi:NRAMP family divalent metal transporter [Phaeocystidibacter luteus]|uniref:Divalent metal cation transporter n=1 Tax=Phaeocystidibacter luteus TaxID=911197 RepID=A0A6N6RL08_9FLAO|nr:divalent metal cation transporter [Phaeocystidibacter luteus]KAB2814257.1 divalent metal cation transporter [Phaeocystidibacter luteus]
MRKYLGPGILFAATAIGVSHLVQSTRAGADYGWSFLWIILLANVLKFPFFEFGTRYANATGESLIEGYRKLGKWAVVLYAATTLSSMFTVTAAVSIVTAGLFAQLVGWEGSFGLLTVAIFALCFVWLSLGKYKFLDRSIKVIIGILFLSTVAAFVTTALNTGLHPEWSTAPDWGEITDVSFTLALVGWMPTAVDLSVWNSIWTVNKMKGRDVGANLKEVLREFHLGYWLSAVSALLFLGLGTMLMYNSSEDLPAGAVGFAGALVDLYAVALGPGFKSIIVVAATAAMFSTTLSVFDGYGRTTRRLVRALLPTVHFSYWIALGVVAVGGWLLVVTYQDKMRELVDLAMLISLVIAPIIAVLNHKLVHSSTFPLTHRPGKPMTLWSYVGIVALVLLSGAYLLY